MRPVPCPFSNKVHLHTHANMDIPPSMLVIVPEHLCDAGNLLPSLCTSGSFLTRNIYSFTKAGRLRWPRCAAPNVSGHVTPPPMQTTQAIALLAVLSGWISSLWISPSASQVICVAPKIHSRFSISLRFLRFRLPQSFLPSPKSSTSQSRRLLYPRFCVVGPQSQPLRLSSFISIPATAMAWKHSINTDTVTEHV